MDNIVNFNRHRPPILKVPMFDEAGTVLHVVPPTVDLQEELRARAGELNTLLTGTDPEMRDGMFDLAARLMSCNRNMMTITPEMLRTTFELDEEDLVVFFNDFVDFVQRLENAKN